MNPKAIAGITLGAGIAVATLATRRVRPLHRDYEALATAISAGASVGPLVTEADLAELPEPIAAYLRLSGAVGRPRVRAVHATMRGRIRSAADAPWMPFRSEQVNTFGPDAARVFLMRARMHGLPVEVLHDFVADTARMRVRAFGVVPILERTGPELVQAETVTILNDLCLFAPGALLDDGVTWLAAGRHDASMSYTRRGVTIRADLAFGADGRLADFVSDDRFRDDTPQRWSTPLIGCHDFAAGHLTAAGAGVWHAPEPEGTFSYLEVMIDDVEPLPAALRVVGRAPVGSAP